MKFEGDDERRLPLVDEGDDAYRAATVGRPPRVGAGVEGGVQMRQGAPDADLAAIFGPR
jgi:hypothetical protein